MEKQSQTKKSSKSIYEKVLDVMQQVGKVEKSAKKNGMHFNPIEHD